mgnify:CR=1 FL=1
MGPPDIPLRVTAAAFPRPSVSLQVLGAPGPSRADGARVGEPRCCGSQGNDLLFLLLYDRHGDRVHAPQPRDRPGDRRGAIRLAAFIFATHMLVWAVGALTSGLAGARSGATNTGPLASGALIVAMFYRTSHSGCRHMRSS